MRTHNQKQTVKERIYCNNRVNFTVTFYSGPVTGSYAGKVAGTGRDKTKLEATGSLTRPCSSRPLNVNFSSTCDFVNLLRHACLRPRVSVRVCVCTFISDNPIAGGY